MYFNLIIYLETMKDNDDLKNSQSEHSNSQEKEEENDNIDDYEDIDEDRPTLIKMEKKFKNKKKEEDIKIMQKKRKRNNCITDIEYDANKKKLINCYCPNQEELEIFLENCVVKEIKDENEILKLNIPDENIFDPELFIKLNSKKEQYKSSLSVEDLGLLTINDKENSEFCEQLNIEERSDKFQSKNEKNFWENDILLLKDKVDFNKLIKDIKKIKIEEIIKNKGDKLNIVFDLDNTCIFNFIIKKKRRLY